MVNVVGQTPSDTYTRLRRRVIAVKADLQMYVTQSQAGSVGYDFVHSVYRTVVGLIAEINTAAATPGIQEYIQEQENDPGYDAVAEYVALRTALQNVATTMENNIPLAVTLRPLAQWGSAHIVSNLLTAPQQSGLQTLLQNVINLIITE